MTDMPISNEDIVVFTRLAAVLIPSTDKMPAATELDSFEPMLRRAIKACGHSPAKIRSALDLIPPGVDWDAAKSLAAQNPEFFQIASEMVSAAYFMSPAVLKILKFPRERQNPASMEEFLDEYETGILEPVKARGPRYRET